MSATYGVPRAPYARNVEMKSLFYGDGVVELHPFHKIPYVSFGLHVLQLEDDHSPPAAVRVGRVHVTCWKPCPPKYPCGCHGQYSTHPNSVLSTVAVATALRADDA